MKKTIILIGLMVSFVAAAAFVGNPKSVLANSQAVTAPRKITVTGQGSVKVKPDVAYITLGVQTESADAKEAQSKNTEIMTKVIDSVKANGISEKDIKTAGYYMYPQYNYNEREEKLTGYSVSNSVTVTVRNLEKAGDIIDAAISAGANTTSNIQFNISDPAPYYQQALSAAMENAKSKGTAIAGSLGVKIDLPLEVAEQSGYYAPLAYGNMNTQAAYDSSARTPIQTGELEISASVQVIYGY